MPRLRKRLRRARDEHRLAQVRVRKGSVEGYVVAVSRDWCALRSADGGLAVLRVDAIRGLGKGSHRTCTRRALEADGRWPPRAPALLDLYDVRSLLLTAGSLSPVLAVTVRGQAQPVVGAVFRITRRHLVLGSPAEVTARVRLADVVAVQLPSAAARPGVGVDHRVDDPG